MGKRDEINIKKIEETLMAAHRKVQEFPVSRDWHEKVMKHVRQLADLKATADNTQVFNHMVWQFATATSLCAVILTFYALNTGINPDYLLANLFFSDPSGFTTGQPFLP